MRLTFGWSHFRCGWPLDLHLNRCTTCALQKVCCGAIRRCEGGWCCSYKSPLACRPAGMISCVAASAAMCQHSRQSPCQAGAADVFCRLSSLQVSTCGCLATASPSLGCLLMLAVRCDSQWLRLWQGWPDDPCGRGGVAVSGRCHRWEPAQLAERCSLQAPRPVCKTLGGRLPQAIMI